jgi:AcrR family transcriptional regulator
MLAREARKSGRGGGRSRILEAARELFNNGHFSDVAMSHVARAAGVTKAALYYHFADKVDLYMQVILRQVDEMQAQMDQAVDAPGTPEERLIRVAAATYEGFDRDLFRLISDHNHLDEARHREVHAALERGQQTVARVFADMPTRWDSVMTPRLAASLFSTFVGVSIAAAAQAAEQSELTHLPTDSTERARIVVRLFLDGYRSFTVPEADPPGRLER